ncbi:MAG: class I SAM-dependent methyltransferase [Cycloclasticus sp.]
MKTSPPTFRLARETLKVLKYYLSVLQPRGITSVIAYTGGAEETAAVKAWSQNNTESV